MKVQSAEGVMKCKVILILAFRSKISLGKRAVIYKISSNARQYNFKCRNKITNTTRT